MVDETDQQLPQTVKVDGSKPEEKLIELLEWGSEADELDYKEDCGLSQTKDQVELVRDMVPMTNTGGGYVLVGVDEKKSNAQRNSPLTPPWTSTTAR